MAKPRRWDTARPLLAQPTGTPAPREHCGGHVFGFVPLPASVVLAMIALTLVYVGAAEVAKRFFHVRRA